MNLKAHHPRFKDLGRSATGHRSRVRDLDRVPGAYGGPFLFRHPAHDGRCHVRAVATRFPHLRRAANSPCAQYCKTIMALPEMIEWIAAARSEPDESKNSTWSSDSAFFRAVVCVGSTDLKTRSRKTRTGKMGGSTGIAINATDPDWAAAHGSPRHRSLEVRRRDDLQVLHVRRISYR